MSKLKSIGGAIERALVGSESLSPELKEFTEKYVHSTGRAKHLPSRKSKLLNFAIGPEGAANILKARYTQGGVLGPGGIILGELAPSQEYIDLLKRISKASGNKIIDPATGKEITRRRGALKAIAKTPLEALNPAFLLGFPAYDTYSALKAKPGDENYGARGVGGALGSGLGFILGAPLGLVGGIGLSHIGHSLGESAGDLFSGTPRGEPVKSEQVGKDILDKQIPVIAAKALFDAYRHSDYTS
jgi:hypothetical protein